MSGKGEREMLRVFVPKEGDSEARVALTPESAKALLKAGLEVVIEAGAGEASFYPDERYQEVGAVLATDVREAWSSADLVLKVAGPRYSERLQSDEAQLLKQGATLIAFLNPARELDAVARLADGGVSSLAMELVPRITRAQKMDALSSQASLGGYKAVLLAACHLPKYFPLLMTAAGTIKPARVVVMGAGVAGLQAIATAKRLGAVVHASDIRPAVQEQIESLGGKFIPLPELDEGGQGEGGYARQMSPAYLAEQQRIVHDYLVQADVVICTALVPGKKAPRLVVADTVAQMKPGSVIVDMATSQGGNCELSEKDRDVRVHGVLIIGQSNLPATVPQDASLVYGRNVAALAMLLLKDGKIQLDLDDEIVAGSLVTHGGKVVHEATAQAIVALHADEADDNAGGAG